MLKKFNIILAIDKFNGIGYRNDINNLYYIHGNQKKIWHILNQLQHIPKNQTTKCCYYGL